MASKALESNSPQALRAALTGVYAVQVQTQRQRQRKAYQAPAYLTCAACGKTVAVRRRPRPGQHVYCRNSSRCRVRAFRARRRQAQAQIPVTETAGQPLGPAAGTARETAGQRPVMVPTTTGYALAYELSPQAMAAAFRVG